MIQPEDHIPITMGETNNPSRYNRRKLMQKKIDELKSDLDDLMSKKEKDPEAILRISEELDVLIVEYYRMIGINIK